MINQIFDKIGELTNPENDNVENIDNVDDDTGTIQSNDDDTDADNDDDTEADDDTDADDDDDDDDYDDYNDDVPNIISNKIIQKSTKLTDEVNDDDSDADSEYDDDDENYLQKFDENIKNQIISEFHPELQMHNYDEILNLAIVVRDKTGTVIDPLHRTLPFITRYEKAKILGERAKQINSGSLPLVVVDNTVIDGYIIALKEYDEKKKYHLL